MERIRSLDLARGFTVLFIPAIHTGMLYSDLSVHDTLLGYFLMAIAEGPGGQLLMLLMGLSFTFRPSHPTVQILIKSIGLLMAGYLLNVLKFVVPYSVGLLPQAVLQDLQIHSSKTGITQLIAIGDILHFAGMALLMLHLLYRRKEYHGWALAMAALIVFVSPLVWDIRSGIPVLDDVLNLATGQPPQVFFPLFPWLAYPLIGLCIGYGFRRDPSHTMTMCGYIGGTLVTIGLISDSIFSVANPAGFYRTPPAATLWHLGIVMITLYAWHFISSRVRDNFFFRLLTYSSRNITLLYIIQWVMIGWLLPVFGYQKLGLMASAIVMVAMTINTYLLCFTFQQIKLRYANRQ